jgi:hypothetical protein
VKSVTANAMALEENRECLLDRVQLVGGLFTKYGSVMCQVTKIFSDKILHQNLKNETLRGVVAFNPSTSN